MPLLRLATFLECGHIASGRTCWAASPCDTALPGRARALSCAGGRAAALLRLRNEQIQAGHSADSAAKCPRRTARRGLAQQCCWQVIAARATGLLCWTPSGQPGQGPHAGAIERESVWAVCACDVGTLHDSRCSSWQCMLVAGQSMSSRPLGGAASATLLLPTAGQEEPAGGASPPPSLLPGRTRLPDSAIV